MISFAHHERTNSLLFQSEDPFQIRSLIPQSRTLDHDQFNIAVKHTLDAVRILRNMGLEAPIPPYDYPGKHQPKSHQLVMVDFHATHPRGFNLSDMGAMKTAAVLWAADLLMKQGEIQRAIIFAKLSTLDTVWMQELFDTLMHRSAVIVHGSPEKRAKALAMDKDFYVTNHDGVGRKEIFDAVASRKDIGLLVVDEGSVFRNHSTDNYKRLVKMIQPWHRLWWMSGGPCPQAPTDAWSQARIINPQGVPKFLGAFKRATMTQISQFKWVPKPDGIEMAYSAMQPAVRFKKADVIDLPPVVTINLKCELSDAQKKTYTIMRNHMQMEVSGHKITAVNAADEITKLRQVLCGSVKDPVTGDYLAIDHAPRLKVLLEAIEEASAKVIVIVPFKGITHTLGNELRKAGYTIGIVNGDVSRTARDKIFTAFKREVDPHILLCHPTVMAHGLNLTEADTLIFYAPIYSNDEYSQVIERFNRAGQTRKMTIVRIGANPLEWAIYKMVDKRKTTQEDILSLYTTAITEVGSGD